MLFVVCLSNGWWVNMCVVEDRQARSELSRLMVHDFEKKYSCTSEVQYWYCRKGNNLGHCMNRPVCVSDKLTERTSRHLNLLI